MNHDDFINKYVAGAITNTLEGKFEGRIFQESLLSEDMLKKYIELKVHGIVVGDGSARPLIIMKDQGGVNTAPIWLKPIELGMTMVALDANQRIHSPHNLSVKILESVGQQIKVCLFRDVQEQLQLAELVIVDSNKRETHVSTSADQAVSLSLIANAQFFATEEFLLKSRTIQVTEDSRKDILMNEMVKVRPPKYLM